jgi:hypothetical protein
MQKSNLEAIRNLRVALADFKNEKTNTEIM